MDLLGSRRLCPNVHVCVRGTIIGEVGDLAYGPFDGSQSSLTWRSDLMLKNVLIILGVICALSVLQPPLTFATTPAQNIENRRWRIARYRADGTQKRDEQSLVDAAKTAEITFSKGRVSGSPTCGGLDGTYTLRGDQLTVHADFFLAGLCPEDQLAQNQLVLNALKGVLRIEKKDDHVLLYDKDDKARVLLVPY
jgi:heat shock protein HslJ